MLIFFPALIRLIVLDKAKTAARLQYDEAFDEVPVTFDGHSIDEAEAIFQEEQLIWLKVCIFLPLVLGFGSYVAARTLKGCCLLREHEELHEVEDVELESSEEYFQL